MNHNAPIQFVSFIPGNARQLFWRLRVLPFEPVLLGRFFLFGRHSLIVLFFPSSLGIGIGIYSLATTGLEQNKTRRHHCGGHTGNNLFHFFWLGYRLD